VQGSCVHLATVGVLVCVIKMSHVTHMRMCVFGVRGSVMNMNESCHTYERVMSHIHMSHTSVLRVVVCQRVM